MSDEDEVRRYFKPDLRDTFWDNPPRSPINQAELLGELHSITTKLSQVTQKTLLKAEKVFRPHIACSIKHYATVSVGVNDISKQRKITNAFSPLLAIMLLVHYDEIKQISVAGRDLSKQLSPVKCQALLANIFIRQLLLLWI